MKSLKGPAAGKFQSINKAYPNMKILVALLFITIAPARSAWHEDTHLLFNYSYLDLIIPGKWGFSVGIKFEDYGLWEVEYLKSTLGVPLIMDDIGSMSDTRITLIKRKNIWFESFNFGYGISYFDFNVFIGDRFLDTLSSGASPSSDVVETQSLGTYLSLGNRWRIGDSFLFGIDWIAWSQPWIKLKQESDFFEYAEGQDDRETVRDVLSFVRTFPRITLLKLQIGARF